MAITHVSETTVGAPNSGRISGTAGDLGAMIAYAVGLQGWATEFGPTANKWVFRPATGNRFRLWVQDDGTTTSTSAANACVRACESATSASSVTDPFPQVSQVADTSSSWAKSSAANTTARNFDIWVGDTWLIYAINPTGGVNTWDVHWFGDVAPALSGDTYGTVITVRNSTNATGSPFILNGCCTQSNNGVQLIYWARTYDGTTKSPMGAALWGNAAVGSSAALPPCLAGPSNKIDRQKMALLDNGNPLSIIGSTTLGLMNRGYFPNLWMPLHGGPGTVNARDTFQDTAYNASAAFTLFRVTNTGTSACIAVETTPTWAPPVG